MTHSEIAAAQKDGKVVCIVDTTRTFDVLAANTAGVDVGRLLVSQPDTEGQTFDVTESLVRSGAVNTVVVFGGLPRACAARIRALAEKTKTEVREC